MNAEFYSIVEMIYEKDPRYSKDAYVFVMESLSYTKRKFKASRHVTGEQMLEGMKEFLLNQYGPLALTVLEYWGIKKTEDFGNIIFHMVENKILGKTADDNFETFRQGYDFHEVFHVGYRKQLAKKISRMRATP